MNNNKNEAISLLIELEWILRYSYDTGWPCCPICRGIKPGFGKDENGNLPTNSGHYENCKLKNILTE